MCIDASNASVLKQTRLGTYGEHYYLEASGLVYQQNSWPLEYLIRLRLWEKLFGAAPQSLGMTTDGRFVSRQKFIQGTPPSQAEVDLFLQGELTPVRQDCWLWKRVYPVEEYEIWVGDARADNFVLTPEGIVPIDLRLWYTPLT